MQFGRVHGNKVWLQTYLDVMVTTPTKKINMITYFKNIIVELHVFYILKTRVQFYAN